MSAEYNQIGDPDFHNESELFAKELDIERMEFEDVMVCLIEFAKKFIINENFVLFRELDLETKNKLIGFVEHAEEYLTMHASATETENARVEAWSLHDSLTSDSAKQIAEIAVLCLYDRESSEYDTFGSEAMIESIMTSLSKIKAGLCKEFRLFVKNHVPSLVIIK